MSCTRVMIFGTFDLLHPGHDFLIKAGQKRGDVTIVVARDSNVHRIKGRPSVESEQERMKAIKEAFPTAEVILGDAHDFLRPLREHKPDLLLLGYDQRMPPGITAELLGVKIERAEALEPHRFKSSLMTKQKQPIDEIDEK